MANELFSAIVSLTATFHSLQNIINLLLFICWQHSVLMRIKKSLLKTLYKQKQSYPELRDKTKEGLELEDESQENIHSGLRRSRFLVLFLSSQW